MADPGGSNEDDSLLTYPFNQYAQNQFFSHAAPMGMAPQHQQQHQQHQQQAIPGQIYPQRQSQQQQIMQPLQPLMPPHQQQHQQQQHQSHMLQAGPPQVYPSTAYSQGLYMGQKMQQLPPQQRQQAYQQPQQLSYYDQMPYSGPQRYTPQSTDASSLASNINYTTTPSMQQQQQQPMGQSAAASPLPLMPTQMPYSANPISQAYPNASYVNLKPSPVAMGNPASAATPSATYTNNRSSSYFSSPSQHQSDKANASSTTNNTSSASHVPSSTTNTTTSSNPDYSASAEHQQPYTPFGFVPTMASRVPVHDGTTSTTRSSSKSGTSRRRRTGSKRSIEEMIMESSIPTATSMDPHASVSLSASRQGSQYALLSLPLTMGGIVSPSMIPATAPTLPLSIPEPPLATATPSNPNVMKSDLQPRPKKKSKYSAEQDAIILRMKKEGKPWSDICEAAKCGNSIAARNRYQVLIGQQGGGAVVWESQDTAALKALLEEGEKTKWNFIAHELTRIRNKKATAKACQGKIKELFDNNPSFFGIVSTASIHHPSNQTYAPYHGAHLGGGTGPGPYGPPLPGMPGMVHPSHQHPHPHAHAQMVLPPQQQHDFADMLQSPTPSAPFGVGGPPPGMIPDYTMRK